VKIQRAGALQPLQDAVSSPPALKFTEILRDVALSMFVSEWRSASMPERFQFSNIVCVG
jgi:hypothetical protein